MGIFTNAMFGSKISFSDVNYEPWSVVKHMGMNTLKLES